MDPGVESALIGALVGVGGTVIVAFLGFRNARAALADALQVNNEALQATRAGQLAELYTRAIDQLGSTTVDITIGGIYALERIARDSRRTTTPRSWRSWPHASAKTPASRCKSERRQRTRLNLPPPNASSAPTSRPQ